MDFGIAETGFARGSPPGTTTEVLRVGLPYAEIRFVSLGVQSRLAGLMRGHRPWKVTHPGHPTRLAGP
jgi:hypothetical protein